MSEFYKKSILVFAAFIILIFAMIFLFLKPAVSKNKQMKKEIQSKQLELDQDAQKLASLQKAEKNKTEIDEIARTVVKYLPNTLDSGQFIVETEGLAKNLGITIDNFSMNETSLAFSGSDSDKKSKKSSKSGIMENGFSLTVAAPYEKALEFLSNMERLSRFNRIYSADILPNEAGSVNLKIVGKIFYEQ